MNFQHHTAAVNGIQMHYATAGSGELILFLHGFPEYWGVWKKPLADLSKDYLVVAPDQRGYNQSSRPEGVASYGIKHLVEDIRALVEHLGQKRIYLVAQDWGAIVGWSFLMRYPSYVKKFVTINITHLALFNQRLREHPGQQAASQYMHVFRSSSGENMIMDNDFAAAKQQFGDHVKNGSITQADLDELIAALKQPGAVTAALN